MNKYSCKIVEDLLPLYADEVCSDESRRLVAEHISECKECRSTLEKMGRELTVIADNDISVVNRIKKRIRTEKIIIGFVIAFVVLIGVFFGGFYLLITDCSMDYEKYNISENVKIIEEENGDLWWEFYGSAKEGFAYPTIRDANGNLLSYDSNFDKTAKEAYGITLKHIRVLEFVDTESYDDSVKRKFIGKKSDIEYSELFYYDDENDKTYTLWRNE